MKDTQSMKLRKDLADKIKKLQKEKRLDNKQLCDMFNYFKYDDGFQDDILLSESSLSEILRCKRTPGYPIIAKLARVFDVSTDYLLGLEKEKTNKPDVKVTSDVTKIPTDTIEKFSALIEKFPKLQELSYLLGFCLDDLVQMEEALSYKHESADSKEHKLMYDSILGKLYMILGLDWHSYDYNLVPSHILDIHDVSESDIATFPNGDSIKIDSSIIGESVGRSLGKSLTYRSMDYKLYKEGRLSDNHYEKLYYYMEGRIE